MGFSVDKFKEVAKKIAEERGLSLVLLFGSQARGKTHRGSDFDFGVLGERRFSPLEIADLVFSFSQAFKLSNVEIADLKSAPPLLMKEMFKDGLLLYEKESLLFLNFKIYAVRRYTESKPLLELRRVQLERFLQTA